MNTVTCPLCQTALRPTEEAASVVRCPVCSGMVFCDGKGPQVVIAHESEALCRQMGTVLLEVGMTPLRAADGAEVMRLLEAFRPAAVVLDVGLSRVLTFQLVEYIRRTPALKNTKVLLVASVFKKTAYKRRPTSLYGADDYVEQHHIPDMLARKLAKLLEHDIATVDGHVEERRALIEATQARSDLGGALRVRALAHSIVADIALYHQGAFEKAVCGEQSDLEEPLQEGRRLLAEIVEDPTAHGGSDPIGEAFSAFINEMRRAIQ